MAGRALDNFANKSLPILRVFRGLKGVAAFCKKRRKNFNLFLNKNVVKQGVKTLSYFCYEYYSRFSATVIDSTMNFVAKEY